MIGKVCINQAINLDPGGVNIYIAGTTNCVYVTSKTEEEEQQRGT